MFFRKLIHRRLRAARRRHKIGLPRFVRAAVTIELLDQRIFLSSSYSAASAVSFITLLHHAPSSHDVDVYLDGAGSPTTTLTPDANNQIEIIGHHTGFKLIDKISAATKPTGGVTFHVLGTNPQGTLEVDATDADTLIEVPSSTATSTTVTTFDQSVIGNDIFGTGVSNLIIRTNDLHTDGTHTINDFFPNGGTTVNVATASLPELYPTIHLTIDTGSGTFDKINLGGLTTGEAVVGAVVKTGAGHDIVTLQDDNDDATTASVDFGAGTGTGTGNGLGLGNQLNVHQHSSATLVQETGSSHTIVVDQVNLFTGETLGGTLIVADESTIGDVVVQSGCSALIEAGLTVAASGSLTGTFTVDDGGSVDVAEETHLDNAVVDGTLFVEASSMIGQLSGSGTLSVEAADLDLKTSSTIGTLDLEQYATVFLDGRVNPPASSAAKVLLVHVLLFDSISSPTATLDLQDNDLVVDYSSGTPFADIRSLIIHGWNGGNWTGRGIVSSQADTHTGLGYAEASVANFGDATVDSTAVIVKYTWYGDANLDGLVNSTDGSILISNFNQTGKVWSQADFDYDGFVGLNDINGYNTNYGQPQL